MDHEKIQILKHMGCNGILITDGSGMVTDVEEDYFYSAWGLKKKDIINKSAYALDEKGVIKPVLAIKVIETKEPVTEVSAVRGNYDVVGEAFPVFAENGEIREIISYTRDVISEQKIHQKYKELLGTKRNEGTAVILNEELFTFSHGFNQIIGKIKKIAPYDITILLTGGTGSGKTTLAKKIHAISGLNGQFISLNCGAIPENLFESELYGYEKGAFTGAERNGRTGLAEAAENGTLLLDEISELPMSQQVKLLDFLEERKIRRVGGNQAIAVNCRVIAATNKKLEELVSKGQFREDLFFRLNVASFEIPNLANRREDIVPFANNMLKGLNEKYARRFVLSEEVLNLFMKYSWPGNLRELENVIHSMVLTSESDILTREMIPFFIIEASETYAGLKESLMPQFTEEEDYRTLIEKAEYDIFNYYFSKYGSSVKVSQALKISQTTAARKIRKYIMHEGTQK